MRFNPLFLALVSLLVWPWVVDAGQCPSICTCIQSSVTCSNVTATQFGQLFNELDSTVFERFVVSKCATPLGRIDGFPKTFSARSLEISGCGITGFGSDAFKYMANDLTELRLMNNSLSAMPFLQNLKKLEMLNMNKNQVCAEISRSLSIFSISVGRDSGGQFQRVGASFAVAFEEQQDLQAFIVSC